jgi:hypothetical protein
MDCVVLQLALGGSGILALVETTASSDFGGADAHVYVDNADLEHAAPIVEDFKERRREGRCI